MPGKSNRLSAREVCSQPRPAPRKRLPCARGSLVLLRRCNSAARSLRDRGWMTVPQVGRVIMHDLPVFRVNLLRCGYALIAVGLAIQIWPQIINPATQWELQRSVVVSMLGAMGLLSALGLRYPL